MLRFAGDAVASDEYRRKINRLNMARKIKKFLSVPKYTVRARGPARRGGIDRIAASYPQPVMPDYLRQLAGLRSWVQARSVDWQWVTRNTRSYTL